MASECFVRTQPLQQAVRGREADVLAALRVPWEDGAPHIACPYPDHSDNNPSWRWQEHKARAFCTCIDRPGGHSILEVVMRVEGLEFEAAKLRVAEILGREDLIGVGGDRDWQAMDAASLLRPPADQRDDSLPRSYFAYRLGVPQDEVMMPSTPVVGWRSLAYYDPPAKKGDKPRLVGSPACIVFGTSAQDGGKHAHRIYVATGGAGKADLGIGPNGQARDPKKSAKLKAGQRAAGCAVLWVDPTRAPHLLLGEGIETSAALALSHRAEIEAGDLVVAAALSASGMRAFGLWPATRKVTVAADRDENKPENDRGLRAGERAARAFAHARHERVDVRIAMPGDPGQDVDWPDVLRSAGVEAVRTGVAAARPFEPPVDHDRKPGDADANSDKQQTETALREIVARARTDRSAPFEAEALARIAAARKDDPPRYQRVLQQLKQAGVRMRDLERELRRASFRIIEGGGTSAGFEATIGAGPYFVTPDGIIAWRKETREGVVPQPLCNFTARQAGQERPTPHDEAGGTGRARDPELEQGPRHRSAALGRP